MIQSSKQAWEVGQSVNVGFMRGLEVIAKVATPGDYAPDAYLLARNAKFYRFVPHNGIAGIDQAEAAEMMSRATH